MVFISGIKDFLFYGLPIRAARIRGVDALADLADLFDSYEYCDITHLKEHRNRRHARRTNSLFLLCPKDIAHNPWLVIRRACLSDDLSEAWYSVVPGQKIKNFLSKKLNFFIKTGQAENSERVREMLKHFGVVGFA